MGSTASISLPQHEIWNSKSAYGGLNRSERSPSLMLSISVGPSMPPTMRPHSGQR